MLTPYPPSSLALSTFTTGQLMIASRARRRFCLRGWKRGQKYEELGKRISAAFFGWWN